MQNSVRKGDAVVKVFVTGATGFIGSAVVDELVANGHSVIGLARTAESAKKLANKGLAPLRGILDDQRTLAKAASEADGVIHLAFMHTPAKASFSRLVRIIAGFGKVRTGFPVISGHSFQ